MSENTSTSRPRAYGARDGSEPIWQRRLVELDSQLRALTARREGLDADALVAVDRAAGTSLNVFRHALDPPGEGIDGVAGDLVRDAAALLSAVASACRVHTPAGGDRVPSLCVALEDRLTGYERRVLTGEKTYEIEMRSAEHAVGAARLALDMLRDEGEIDLALLGLQRAAVAVAALMVRAAGNLDAEGRAGDATCACPHALTEAMCWVIRDIEASARTLASEPPGEDHRVGHHLRAALGVSAPVAKLESLKQSGSDRPLAVDVLDGARAAWRQIAAHELLAVRTLNADLGTPTYSDCFDALGDALAARSISLLCAGRLVARPEAFDMHGAWAHQARGITHALEAYTDANRGLVPAEAYAHTALIVLARLPRSAAALVILDLCRGAPPGDNGSAAQPTAAERRSVESGSRLPKGLAHRRSGSNADVGAVRGQVG